MDIADLITDRRLLGPFFAGSSRDRWRAVLKASYGLPLSDVELPLFKEVAGDGDHRSVRSEKSSSALGAARVRMRSLVLSPPMPRSALTRPASGRVKKGLC